MTEDAILISQSIHHALIKSIFIFSDDILNHKWKEQTVSVVLEINTVNKTYSIKPKDWYSSFEFHNSSYWYRWGLIADLIKEANRFAQNYISNLDNNEANK